jgi:trigger factor
VAEQKLLTVGAPSIGVTKMAPGNPFIYTATVTLLPSVELCDLSKISVSAKQLTVSDIDVAKSVKDLRTMRATETVTTNAAGMQDKVVIDMDMKLGGVSLEGGQAKGHQVYLSEPYYIPGLTDQLLGLKKDDAKTFTLTFPKEHYQKNVAGKPVDFEIKVTDVFERTLPAHDDAFAQTLGQKTVAELDTLIRENLLKEAQDKENQRQEIAALEEVVKHSKFGDLPDLLVNEEVLRMIEEMKAGISQRGMDWQQYLDQAKKTELQLKLDFTAQAIQRIKVALVVRALAAKDQVDVTDAEVAAEIEREMNLYSDDADMQAQIRTPEYHDRVHVVLRNRKVVESLKKQVIK